MYLMMQKKIKVTVIPLIIVINLEPHVVAIIRTKLSVSGDLKMD